MGDISIVSILTRMLATSTYMYITITSFIIPVVPGKTCRLGCRAKKFGTLQKQHAEEGSIWKHRTELVRQALP